MPAEIARKLAVTVEHIVNLVDDESFADGVVKRIGSSRRSIRVPLESYRSFILKRSSRQALPASQASIVFPSLDFRGDKALTIDAIEEVLMLTSKHIANLIDGGALHAIDVRAAASKRHAYRVPIEAYRQYINARVCRPSASSS